VRKTVTQISDEKRVTAAAFIMDKTPYFYKRNMKIEGKYRLLSDKFVR
jgi:hypothetical protein